MLCAGVIAAAVINSNPFRKEGSDPVSPLDFVPEYKRRAREAEPRQTAEEQKLILTQLFGCGPGKPN